jgi:hypothetical protein
MVHRRYKSTPSEFFWVVDRGRPEPAAHRGCARHRRSRADQATCRRVVLMLITGSWIAIPRGIKQKLLEGILNSEPAAARAPWLPARNDRAPGLRGGQRAAGLEFVRCRSTTRRPVAAPRRCRAPAASAGLCGPFELPMPPIGTIARQAEAERERRAKIINASIRKTPASNSIMAMA